jgi:hypothetical protein
VKPHITYLWYVLRHKWYVFRACLVLGVPLWRALIHDWTKFTPAEWGPYVLKFAGGRRQLAPAEEARFAAAWLHHWTNNPHHWQYWARSAPDDGARATRPMPETYVREMVADWYGAGMAQGKPDIYGWYTASKGHRQFDEDTHALVVAIVAEARAKGLFA